MLISEVENLENVQNNIIQRLRKLGIKFRLKKNNQTETKRTHRVFKVPLSSLSYISVISATGFNLKVPKVIHELCSFILCNVETEGLFRKAGSSARQKEIKISLDAGCTLSNDHHVIDIANVLKQLLRDLPEPLIPAYYHDPLVRSLLLNANVNQAVLLLCLLLPEKHLHTLTYLMQFLKLVAAYSSSNKMDIKNLAIVLTPTLMPMINVAKSCQNKRLSRHVELIQKLMENADELFVLPDDLYSNVIPETAPKRHKRRSGSLTRMFTSLKKMVSGRSEDDDCPMPDLLSSPSVTRSAKKRRRVSESLGFQSKKKREAVPLSNVIYTPVSTHPAQSPLASLKSPSPHWRWSLAATPTADIHQSSDDFIRIPKSEYEEIKNRVSAIEDCISQELASVTDNVQTAYEKTMEEAGTLCSPTTEHLAKRLSRELKIRRSSDNQIIRSPSARKISSIRRRSYELDLQKSGLKRGRPNTVTSGLPTPFNKTPTVENADWTCAEGYFIKTPQETGFTNSHFSQEKTGRPSLQRLRVQNAGMVVAKAKLFDGLVGNTDTRLSDTKTVHRRTSSRRRDKENVRICKNERLPLSTLQDCNNLLYDNSTPMPTIRKSLGNSSVRKIRGTPAVDFRPAVTPLRAPVPHKVRTTRLDLI